MIIITACDKFKGTLTSVQANEAIARGIRKILPDAEIISKMMADGGEGSADLFAASTGAVRREVKVKNPIGKEIITDYLVSDGTAFIEMSKASGLALLKREEYSPLYASSYGFGQMILDAFLNGAREIITGIGGSAVNDGGAGMLQALGFSLQDSERNELKPGGEVLNSLSYISISKYQDMLSVTKFITACDVDNPLLGARGAVMVYSGQKGAGDKEKDLLEKALANFARVAAEFTGKDYRGYPGAGAAGGTGFSLKTFLNSEMRPGWEVMASLSDLENAIKRADLVITGEGSFDSQSINGKLVSGVIELARRHNKPIWIFCGVNSVGPDLPYKQLKVFSISSIESSRERCEKFAEPLLEKIAESAATFNLSLTSNL
jgi:glycerate kinase